MKDSVYFVIVSCLLLLSCSKNNEKVLTLSDNKVEFTSDGGEQVIIVSANTHWEANSKANWVEVETFGRTGNGSIVIKVKSNYFTPTINDQPNYSAAERTAIISVMTSDSGIKEKVIISQAGHTDSPFNVYMVVPSSETLIPFNEGIDVVGKPLRTTASFDNFDIFPSSSYGVSENPWEIQGQIKDGEMVIDFLNTMELTPEYETFTHGLRVALLELRGKNYQNTGRDFFIFLFKENFNRQVNLFYLSDGFSNELVTLEAGWNFIETLHNSDWIYGEPFWHLGMVSQDICVFLENGYRWVLYPTLGTSPPF